MKNPFFVVFLCLLCTSLFAQPKAKQLYIGGGINLDVSDNEVVQDSTLQSGSSFNLNFLPVIGYTLTDNWLAGARLNIGLTSSNSQVGSDFSGSNFGLTLFSRYNVKISEKFFFFPEFLVGYEVRNFESSFDGVNQNEQEGNMFSIGIAPGFAFFPSEHWSLEFGAGVLGYTRTNSTNLSASPNIETSRNSFGFNLNSFTANLNLAYYLPIGS